MTNYLSQETIRNAVERLGQSRANSALTDYLVFKRALVLANMRADGVTVETVVTGLRAPDYVKAVDELTRVADEGERPHFSPFGARRDTGLGYRSKKYPSNGPSDTVSRWASWPSRPLEHVAGTSPKQFKPIFRTAHELEEILLIKGNNPKSSGRKPLLIDLAIWLHRGSAVSDDDLKDSGRGLVESTKAALGVTDTEIEGLFSVEASAAELLTVVTRVAPVDYLPVPPTQAQKAALPSSASVASVGEADVEDVIGFVAARGFVFDPWQVAAFITAARTKPFVILAGISGTGKTKLPKLVADATGAHLRHIAVRPDWTDSSELLGYERLDGTFVPGELLRVAREAIDNPDQQFFALLDEMNVARVEYYLAEVLSHIEEREWTHDKQIHSAALAPTARDTEWSAVHLPGNLCIVGSVNMDETTFGFSRKVLDRSFVIEFSTVSLSVVKSVEPTQDAQAWDVSRWRPSALSLGEHPLREDKDVERIVAALETINQALAPVQMQVGYRVRDEIAMFVLSARDCADSFVSEDQGVINTLDLAIAMKALPRIQGSGVAIRAALEQLLQWADPAATAESTTGLTREAFPFCADRISMMLQRLDDTGFTSFWL